MESKALATEVAELEARRADLAAQLDAQIAAFGSRLPGLAKDWIRRETGRQVEASPTHVASLEIEKLGAMKVEVQALLERIPDICAKALARPERRPHKGTLPDIRSRRDHDSFFDGLLREVVGPLGSILAKYGFIREGDRESSWEKSGPDGYRFRYNMGFDLREDGAIQQYGQAFERFCEVDRLVQQKRRALDQAKARERWDSV